MNLKIEIISGYKDSAQMKRIWAMELDLVRKFMDVCTHYDLTCWITDGTLLGAVRHNGYIPRDHYYAEKRFQKTVGNRFQVISTSLVFQTPVTEDSRYFYIYVKVHNEDATASSRHEYEQGINCSIFIKKLFKNELKSVL